MKNTIKWTFWLTLILSLLNLYPTTALTQVQAPSTTPAPVHQLVNKIVTATYASDFYAVTTGATIITDDLCGTSGVTGGGNSWCYLVQQDLGGSLTTPALAENGDRWADIAWRSMGVTPAVSHNPPEILEGGLNDAIANVTGQGVNFDREVMAAAVHASIAATSENNVVLANQATAGGGAISDSNFNGMRLINNNDYLTFSINTHGSPLYLITAGFDGTVSTAAASVLIDGQVPTNDSTVTSNGSGTVHVVSNPNSETIFGYRYTVQSGTHTVTIRRTSGTGSFTVFGLYTLPDSAADNRLSPPRAYLMGLPLPVDTTIQAAVNSYDALLNNMGQQLALDGLSVSYVPTMLYETTADYPNNTTHFPNAIGHQNIRDAIEFYLKPVLSSGISNGGGNNTPVPTLVSAFTNDAGYLTPSSLGTVNINALSFSGTSAASVTGLAPVEAQAFSPISNYSYNFAAYTKSTTSWRDAISFGHYNGALLVKDFELGTDINNNLGHTYYVYDNVNGMTLMVSDPTTNTMTFPQGIKAGSTSQYGVDANGNVTSATTTTGSVTVNGIYITKDVTLANTVDVGSSSGATDSTINIASLLLNGTPVTPYTPPSSSTAHVFYRYPINGTGTQTLAPGPIDPTDIPSAVNQYVDFSINSGAVDANAHPAYLVASGNTVIANGATAPINAMINGQVEPTLSTNLTSPAETTAGVYHIFLLYSSGAWSMVVSSMAPQVVHEANMPACVGTVSAPQYVFDLDANGWRKCTVTANGFNLVTGTVQVVYAGAFHTNGTTVDAVLPMPFAMPPVLQYMYWGDGRAGDINPATGTQYVDGFQAARSVLINAGVILTSHVGGSTYQGDGVLFESQDPVFLYGQINTIGVGGGRAAGNTTTGSGPTNGNYGGAGGTGGVGAGGAVKSSGSHVNFNNPFQQTGNSSVGGTAGSPVNGTAYPSAFFASNPIYCLGGTSGGGSPGTGDNTNAGGSGGAPSGPICISGPALYVGAQDSVDCSGQAGLPGAAGNAAGGGGSGGCLGTVTFGYINYASGVTQANAFISIGGAAGASLGTSTAAGAGGAGEIFVYQPF